MRPTTWADRLVEGLDRDVRTELAADPATAMGNYFGLTVRQSEALSQRGEGGWCDGLSFRRPLRA